VTLNWNALWFFAWPHLILVTAAFACLMFSVVSRRGFRFSALLALGALLGAGYGFFLQWRSGTVQSIEVLYLDSMGNFLGALICLVGAITVLYSFKYWESMEEKVVEAIPLLLFSVVGMALMVATNHLLTLVLALELMSLCLYVLVGTRRRDPKSSEAAFKYFLLGSVAAAFMLFGISFLYGTTGTMSLEKISLTMIPADQSLLFKMGVLLLLLGFAFKVAAVPFHFWAPDVYDGSPAPVTGFMAAGVKVAAFGALLRILMAHVGWEALSLRPFLVGLSVATMVVGNLTALRQKSVKRIMAYSSIAHAGYLLLGLATLIEGTEFRSEGLSTILFYLTAYSLLTLGVFALLTLFSSRGREIGQLKDLSGLAGRHPAFAAALSIFLISLAGIPPSVGFFAKYYLFSQAVEVGLIWPAVLGIITSAISLFYYLGPVVRMYFMEAQGEDVLPPAGVGVKFLVVLLVIGVFYLGLFPNRVLEITQKTTPSAPAHLSVR
jgi:NADH-quinone oxidoreductase subunit N